MTTITLDYVNKRKHSRYNKESVYFRPDDDAQYASIHIIDLADVDSAIAQYPSPDNVVPVTKLEGTRLDGCFIGACTTTEENLILAAGVLELGLKKVWYQPHVA
ncbi:hypothetical protein BKA64DRAFT_728371 [Cadophora sp. MPI-SDFR-AT-0126]|nr:hypothetical protein BKA64DRAFT_728371 [Leotiomycetes sp. MPI-SDFR-AT-0126]